MRARLGIFVGGRATRMGGVAKGLLPSPDGDSVVARLVRVGAACGLEATLVGSNPRYAQLGLPTVPDAGATLGPLGGLVAMLHHAPGSWVVLACDMPFVTEALLRRLIAAPPAPVLGVRRDARWEPFFARYEAAALPRAEALARSGRTALQALFEGAAELVLDEDEAAQLRDWDTPEDVSASRTGC